MFLFTKYLPRKLNNVLFGDRKTFGLEVDKEDKDWISWLSTYHDFYMNTQKKGVGKYVNNAGYKILREVDLQDKVVLEIGPGSLPHIDYINGTPVNYIVADIDNNFIKSSITKLTEHGIPSEGKLIKNRKDFSVDGLDYKSVDIIITFYSLEHLYPLDPYLEQYKKYLKTDGIIVGSVPCEGGLAWGLGRYITSRRWLLKNTNINPDKIICWEHPNFVSKIKNSLDSKFISIKSKFFPLIFRSGDFNLVFSFIYKNK